MNIHTSGTFHLRGEEIGSSQRVFDTTRVGVAFGWRGKTRPSIGLHAQHIKTEQDVVFENNEPQPRALLSYVFSLNVSTARSSIAGISRNVLMLEGGG